jgi:folate-dependent phosphoribosylglycinamide formyltransferase PurN
VRRLVVIAAENMASCRITRPIFDALADNISLVMIVPNLPISGAQRRKRAFRLIRSASMWFNALKFVEISVHNFIALLRGQTISQHARQRGLAVKHYSSAADAAFLVDLKQANPDYTLSAGPAILSNSVIAAAKRATLNCHGGRLPEYRGAANYIWMLLAGDRTAYTSVQKMHPELDAGPVLAERSLVIDPQWSAYRLNYELSGIGGQLYADSVRILLDDGTLAAIVRPDSHEKNRGIPQREDMKIFFRRGLTLCRLHEAFTLI